MIFIKKTQLLITKLLKFYKNQKMIYQIFMLMIPNYLIFTKTFLDTSDYNLSERATINNKHPTQTTNNKQITNKATNKKAQNKSTPTLTLNKNMKFKTLNNKSKTKCNTTKEAYLRRESFTNNNNQILIFPQSLNNSLLSMNFTTNQT